MTASLPVALDLLAVGSVGLLILAFALRKQNPWRRTPTCKEVTRVIVSAWSEGAVLLAYHGGERLEVPEADGTGVCHLPKHPQARLVTLPINTPIVLMAATPDGKRSEPIRMSFADHRLPPALTL